MGGRSRLRGHGGFPGYRTWTYTSADGERQAVITYNESVAGRSYLQLTTQRFLGTTKPPAMRRALLAI
jgi:hypothetical protein